MSEQIEQNIISLYSRGMSTRDIEEQVRDLYGIAVSESTISSITNRILDHIKEWQSRATRAHLLYLLDGWRTFQNQAQWESH